MITTVTKLDRVETQFNPPAVYVRLMKHVMQAGTDTELFRQPHRTAFVSLAQFDAQIAATNQHLAELGFPAITAEDEATLLTHAQLAFAE